MKASVLVASVGGRRVADARRHLQRAELHGLVDRDIEGDDAAGDLVEAGEQRAFVGDLLRRRFGDDLVAGLRRDVGRRQRAARRALARRQTGNCRRASVGRRQRLRLHAGPGRLLPGLSGILRLRILLLGILLLRIALVRVTLVGVALVRILRIALRPRAGHARWRTRRRAENRFERIKELRRRRTDAERGPQRERCGNEADGAERSGHRARSVSRNYAGTPAGLGLAG